MSSTTLMQGADLRKLDLKKLDTSIQTRSEIRAGAIAEYATLIKEQREQRRPTGFPAPIVYEVGNRLLLASGHHRVKAHLLAGVTELECEVRQGDELDVIKTGVAENSKQGERLTRADRQHTMTLVLQRHGNLSNRALAEICDVSEGTIRNWRDSLPGAQTTQERIGRDGKSYPAAVSQPRIDRPVANPSHVDHSRDTAADHVDVDDGCDSIEFPERESSVPLLTRSASEAANKSQPKQQRFYSVGGIRRPITLAEKNCYYSLGAYLRELDKSKQELGRNYTKLLKLAEESHNVLSEPPYPDSPTDEEIF